MLTASADPQPGFAGTPGATIPSSEIQIQHVQGSAPNATVVANVAFDTPLNVSANQDNALDLEFDLGNPAFIVQHVAAGTGATIWAVNFAGPIRRRPLHDVRRLVLRQMYGNVTAVASDGSALTIDREFPTEPVVSPETAIATGTAFLANHDLVRGFKVHVSVVDPLATPLVAQSVDIETAAFGGAISAADATGFTVTRNFATPTDDYTDTLDFISPSTPNGSDASGNAIDGFKWWNFAYPTLVDSGPAAIGDFDQATGGSVDFGGTVGTVVARGVSDALWNDPANPNGWSVPAAVLLPSRLPLGEVANGLSNGQFTMTVTGGVTAATIDVGTTAGSATLVYQIDRSNGIVTVSPVDVTTSTGLATLTQALTAGTKVRVYGIPQANGTLKAYVLSYFTGTEPAN